MLKALTEMLFSSFQIKEGRIKFIMEIRFSGISLLFLVPVVCVLSSSRNQAHLEDWSKYFDLQTSYIFVLLMLKRFFFQLWLRSQGITSGTRWEVC